MDEKKIDHLWREYHAALHRFVLSRVGDESVADDIVQEVFLKMNEKIDALREAKKVKSWMYQITRNAIVDYYRGRRLASQLPDSLTSPDKDLAEEARSELGNCMLPLIARLPESYRQAVTLSEIDGLTQRRVAEQLRLSLSGAKSRVQRGRAMIREMLHDCCRIEIDRRGSVVDCESRSVDSGGCCS